MKIYVVVKNQDGEIIVRKFETRDEAIAFAEQMRKIGCEVLVGWGE